MTKVPIIATNAKQNELIPLIPLLTAYLFLYLRKRNHTDKIMKSIVIKNYKNFEYLALENLANVNLIVGRNNVGKSTLLEAFSIVAANGNINWMKEILEMRGESVRFSPSTENCFEKEIERFASLYHLRDLKAFYEVPIKFETSLDQSSEILEFQMVKVTDITETDENGLSKTFRKIINKEDEIELTEANIRPAFLSTIGERKSLYIFNGNNRYGSRAIDDKLYPFEYVRTSLISNRKNPLLFDKLALTPNEKYIIKALQIIEPRIEAINFLKNEPTYLNQSNDERVPIVVMSGNTKRYRLSSMGDGMNRILTIILALLNCENGILLIDEFENGLHHSVQCQLWKIIFELSTELNVQVFATTHSEDCIKCFAEENKHNKGKFIRLENKKGKIVGVSYDDAEKLKFAIDQDIEVR